MLVYFRIQTQLILILFFNSILHHFLEKGNSMPLKSRLATIFCQIFKSVLLLDLLDLST